MRTTALVMSLGAALLVAGCNPKPAGGGPAGGGSADQRIAALEKEVASLKASQRDERMKLRTINSFPGRSPLQDFFDAPEFWQCTYDSSWADCSKRCADAAQERLKACAMKPTEAERLACVKESTDTAAACVKACPVQSSPTEPPNCFF